MELASLGLVGLSLGGTFLIYTYYEDLALWTGLIKPKDLKKRKQIDTNPLPEELRDEYIQKVRKDRRKSKE